MVGTVATTTTSPVAACSARIIRSISAALAGSITLAKSLTGCGELGERVEEVCALNGPADAGHARSTTTGTTAAMQRMRSPIRDRLVALKRLIAASRHRALHPSTCSTRRSTASRYGGNSRSASADVISLTPASLATSVTAPAGRGRVRRAAPRQRDRRRCDALEPGDARDAAPRSGRRLHDQVGQRVAAAARFEKPLAQVQQVAARLHFARAAHVGGVDARAPSNGLLPDTTT